MIDNVIAKPGFIHTYPHHDYRDLHHLFKENYLSEFLTLEEKEIARRNLNVVSKDEIDQIVIDLVLFAIFKGDIDVSDPRFVEKMMNHLEELGLPEDLLIDLSKYRDTLEAIKNLFENNVAVAEDRLNDKMHALSDEVEYKINHLPERYIVTNEQAIWVPTGPVSSTVGYIEDNTVFTKPMTLQEIMDAVFYEHKSGMETDVFVGLLPNLDLQLTYSYLLNLIELDPTNNGFTYFNAKLLKDYNFEDAKLQYLMLAIPDSYDVKISRISINSQSFGEEAFEKSKFKAIAKVKVKNADDEVEEEIEKTITYNVYVYKQGLAMLSTPVVFKFE